MPKAKEVKKTVVKKVKGHNHPGGHNTITSKKKKK